jgi:uncharacterized protein YcfL
MKKVTTILLVTSLLVGCKIKEKEPDGSGSLRLEIFKECMTLAAKLQSPSEALSTTESEVADVVSECSEQAYYMATHITSKE